MRVLVCIDSFKGSVTSKEANHACKKGILSVDSNVIVDEIIVADGGEGTVEAFCKQLNGRIVYKEVQGAYQNKIQCPVGLVDEHNLAVIEVAGAIGLTLQNDRNPLLASTYGVGEIIKYVLDLGYKHLIIGLGGSATNDAGIGMMRALGVKFYDTNNNELVCNANNIQCIDKIDMRELDSRLKTVDITLACDVTNPLCGPNGATYIFGPQKGLKDDQLENLDQAIYQYANKVNKQLITEPGAGAAGGLGFAFHAFTNAKMVKGIDLLLDYARLDERVKDYDLVFSGEGKIDQQSTMGKVIQGIHDRTHQYHVPLILLAGVIDQNCKPLDDTAMFSITDGPISLEEAMNKDTTFNNITSTTQQIINLYKAIEFKHH